MNNNNKTSNDPIRVAVKEWDVSDAVPNIGLEDYIKKNEIDEEVNTDIMMLDDACIFMRESR